MDQGHLGVMVAESARLHPDRIATRVSDGAGWRTSTYAEFLADVRRLAVRLIEHGFEPGDRVALFAPNLPEWSLADLACLSAGLVVVPLYPTSTVDQVRHILGDSGSRAVFIAGAAEWPRLAPLLEELTDLELVISFSAIADVHAPVRWLTEELAEAGEDGSTLDARLEAGRADDLATIIYTSGTTGEPKGVMLSHRGFSHQVSVLNQYFDISPQDSSLCFLPLSHALERAWTYVVFSNGSMNTYVADPKTVAAQLVAARPSLLVSVPRLYEKVFTAAHAKADTPLKRRLMEWALRVGGAYQVALKSGHVEAMLRVQHAIADRLVLRSVRAAVGGDKVVLACGGAPLRQEIEEFFLACGLLLLQGYGLTETSPLVSFPSPEAYRFGTVGRVVDGGEVRIAEGGEICYRGPNLMMGYWNRPQETAAAMVDGWLRTGDVGVIDEDGYLQITDRIKDLIVTSNGKNIAPAPIEGLLAKDPLLEYTILLGDNRPYLTLLVAPSVPQLEDIAGQLQLTWAKREELLSHPEILAEVHRRVTALTSKLARHEQIRDLRLAFEEFTQENGLLTPTLKVKRREVERRFAELVEDMYAHLGHGPGRSPRD